ncbi:hypothetical protein ENUP19_0262G0008 [Entamoeba nuttalli]|uniref:Uncharacterized protein n=1 Tax=Entamoeba nuttalli TaxID=412467 RepID=A0ABQ0DSN4_9EUKA
MFILELVNFQVLIFTNTSYFKINDFLRIRNLTRAHFDGKTDDYFMEPMYLDCLLTHSDENNLVFDFTHTYTFCKFSAEQLASLGPDDCYFPYISFTKDQIKKEYPTEKETSKIIAIVVPSVLGVLIIIIAIIALVVGIIKYRTYKGRQMLKEYDENELSSLDITDFDTSKYSYWVFHYLLPLQKSLSFHRKYPFFTGKFTLPNGITLPSSQQNTYSISAILEDLVIFPFL